MENPDDNPLDLRPENAEDNALDLGPISKDMVIRPEHGIASVALNMSLKYHDINMVKDGALYQQYKLEGRNFRDLHLDMVFETAMRIEEHILNSPNRMSNMLAEGIAMGVVDAIRDALTAEDDEIIDQTGGEDSQP